MRERTTFAVALLVAGSILIASSITSFMLHYALPLNPALFGAMGVILLVASMILLITEVMESWLTHGQTVLVDGLEARLRTRFLS